MSKPQWHGTNNYRKTECDECHNVRTCIGLENEDASQELDVCEECFNKLNEHGHIVNED